MAEANGRPVNLPATLGRNTEREYFLRPRIRIYCKHSLKRKQSRGRFNDGQRETEVLQRVYIDIMVQPKPSMASDMLSQPMNEVLQCITSHYSKRMKSAPETLQWFHVMVERQTGQKLKAIRTDNGIEFCNDLWAEYLQRHGIVHEKATPYTPQQNLGERGRGTARTMMFEAKAPLHLWGEAFKAAAYLLNLYPSRRQNGLTPYELETGKPPTIAHLRVWGCKAFAKIPDERRAHNLLKTQLSRDGKIWHRGGMTLHDICVTLRTKEDPLKEVTVI
jgi:hypothetical protein